MDFKPGDFLLGVIDFFAVILPGAMLAFIFKDVALARVFGPIAPSIDGEAQGWVAFLLASYLLGHFLHFAGSYLDIYLYDPYRRKWLTRNGDLTYEHARKIKRGCLPDKPTEYLKDKEKTEIVNTFQWARANLQIKYPAAAGEIYRLEADSKFFRSLIIVLFIFLLKLIYKTHWVEAVACLVMMGLSFIRYADQRFKSTRLAYTYLIVLDNMQKADLLKEQGPVAKGQGS